MMIPEDEDVQRLRLRVWYSIEASRARRHFDEPDGEGNLVSTITLYLIVVAALALMGLTLGLAGDIEGARAASVKLSERERIMIAWCPSQLAMPRRHCEGWLRVAQCETGGQQRTITVASLRQIQWRYNGRSGYDGALQFSPSTWLGNIGRVPSWKLTRMQRMARARGRYRFAYGAPPSVQMLAADVLRVRPDGGLGQWPVCGKRW